MTKPIRLIPRLDIKGPNLVKGVNLEGLRVLGKPLEFVKYYYNSGADEVIYTDIVASLYDREFIKKIVNETAKMIFIPITVGGGIRTLKDIEEVLRFGADKISLNTAAIKNPKLIKESVNFFGSSTISVSIEAIKHSDGKYYAYFNNGRDCSNFEVIDWAKKIENYGAGEIILTSISNEGTRSGFDIDLIKSVSTITSLPVIVHGGAGKIEHIIDVIKDSSISGVALSSILHYEAISNIKFDKKKHQEGNLEFITKFNSQTNNKNINYKIPQIKSLLRKEKIICRI